ncbi:Aste57867_16874 [Aphanomyces stellatus]|uniref:Peroxisomal trans-2-enoyl-CoA reductase n=1 Tax=Aphanomyces stellatus TaxID=120398 RepID=A0A485L6T0_9STRA|nr:hypothetical protein As57867_016816 [Aphanomyces stellatus]VFT93637.1 Aste57867_16874 [Aphanomyces stellatus]
MEVGQCGSREFVLDTSDWLEMNQLNVGIISLAPRILSSACPPRFMIRVVDSVFRDGIFDGKAVVTGGGTGIGKCIAHELCLLGCSVVIASRKLETLEEATKEIRAQLPPKHAARDDCVFPVQCDVREEDQVKALFAKVMQKFNRVDYVVNNAGGQFASPFADLTLKGWNAVHRLNLTGTFLVTKYAYEAYMKDHGGAIVNIIINMDRGFPFASHSGSSRAAVENLSKSLANEWAAKGIRVNCVAPGTILSSGVKNYGPDGYEMFVSHAKRWPAKRMGSVEEVSAAAVFLLSPASAYTTGTTAVIDGGWLVSTSVMDLPDHDNFPVYGKSKL